MASEWAEKREGLKTVLGCKTGLKTGRTGDWV